MNRKIILLFMVVPFLSFRWGFFAHQSINRMAVFTLPAAMIRFYKSNILYITEHAVDADKRRYIDTAEATRHFIDLDTYGSSPFDSIPQSWNAARQKYGELQLYEKGIVPWQIERSYYSLVRAFQERDSLKILRYSADLGHYISDAHVPLHTTENYNGQLTGQAGIHGFWESRLPELFHHEYDFFVGPARYINKPLEVAWEIVKEASDYKDSVLLIEARLSSSYPSDQKFSYSERNGKVQRQYSEEYSRSYHHAMKGMVERQMRSSVIKTGSYWYSAWLDAGQPDLNDLKKTIPTTEEIARNKEATLLYERGKIIGRPEN